MLRAEEMKGEGDLPVVLGDVVQVVAADGQGVVNLGAHDGAL